MGLFSKKKRVEKPPKQITPAEKRLTRKSETEMSDEQAERLARALAQYMKK
ncbi:hypothetical protein [Marasmitruncus massiliensis]|uniref:hypothetical protein n=1 Tax=Marasmitruncus massiliensis TaxID=1944642 RepID=UPI0015E0DACC|nr:hypothetical protein [Marasmitruncus massiliensis]